MSRLGGRAWWTPRRKEMYSTGYPAIVRGLNERIETLERELAAAQAVTEAAVAWADPIESGVPMEVARERLICAVVE